MFNLSTGVLELGQLTGTVGTAMDYVTIRLHALHELTTVKSPRVLWWAFFNALQLNFERVYELLDNG